MMKKQLYNLGYMKNVSLLRHYRSHFHPAKRLYGYLSLNMHFCFSSKIYGNIESYVAQQNPIDDCGDIALNKLAINEFSSYLYTPQDLRKNVENIGLN